MAQLQISDLSVGDWVEVDGAVTKVWYLSRRDDEVNKTTCDWVKPIPITPEILEKNGFIKNGAYNEWNIGEWDEKPFIGVSLERQSLRVKHFGNDIFIEGKELFVHQLQHALRLAGVEKEIEL